MRYVFCITNHGVYIVEPWEIELVDNADSEIELVQIMTAMRERRQQLERRIFP